MNNQKKMNNNQIRVNCAVDVENASLFNGVLSTISMTSFQKQCTAERNANRDMNQVTPRTNNYNQNLELFVDVENSNKHVYNGGEMIQETKKPMVMDEREKVENSRFGEVLSVIISQALLHKKEPCSQSIESQNKTNCVVESDKAKSEQKLPRETRPKQYKMKVEALKCGKCQIYCNSKNQLDVHLMSTKHAIGYVAVVDLNNNRIQPKEPNIEKKRNIVAAKEGIHVSKYFIPAEMKVGNFEKFGFYCNLCKCYMTGEIQLIMHVKGKKHQYYSPNEIPNYKPSKPYDPSVPKRKTKRQKMDAKVANECNDEKFKNEAPQSFPKQQKQQYYQHNVQQQTHDSLSQPFQQQPHHNMMPYQQLPQQHNMLQPFKQQPPPNDMMPCQQLPRQILIQAPPHQYVQQPLNMRKQQLMPTFNNQPIMSNMVPADLYTQQLPQQLQFCVNPPQYNPSYNNPPSPPQTPQKQMWFPYTDYVHMVNQNPQPYYQVQQTQFPLHLSFAQMQQMVLPQIQMPQQVQQATQIQQTTKVQQVSYQGYQSVPSTPIRRNFPY